MSKLTHSLMISFIVGFLIGGPAMVGALHLFWGESPKDAYERGYEDARLVFLDNLCSRWFNDSLGWNLSLNATSNIRLYSTESEHWYNTVVSDSTDTMPAVESVDWDTIPFNEPLTDSGFKAKMESLGWLDDTHSPMPIILPDTGGER